MELNKMSDVKKDKVVKRPRRKILADSGPLAVKQIPGYHLRWATENDPQDPNNIKTLMERGYTPVTEEDAPDEFVSGDLRSNHGSNLGVSVLKRAVGQGLIAVLMKLPLEFYHEDLKELENFNHSQVQERLKPTMPSRKGIVPVNGAVDI
jgi:hypothetical protein